MFSQSTQSKHWLFSGEAELLELRKECNAKFISTFSENMTDDQIRMHFLTTDEERYLCRHYESILKEFCSRFQPVMPKYVLGTAMVYFKRFYIHNSVMNYHPRDIMLTCVYLACKVEEFNVSISQYVNNLKGDREKFTNIVIGMELQVMEMLHYHLIVHNPFRPLEGFLIDIKTRFTGLNDAEKLRDTSEAFLDLSLTTDVSLLFSPSQIALAAVLTGASKEGASLDSYVTDTLMAGHKREDLYKIVQQVKRIKYLVKNQSQVQREPVKMIEKKLERCRNKENNPDTEEYKRKLDAMFDEEGEAKARKKARVEKEMADAQRELLST